MTEYVDKSMEEITSEFIVGTCQLLPKSSCGVVSDSIHFGKGYLTLCGSAMEFYIRPFFKPCIADVDALLLRNDELAFTEDFPVLPHDVSVLSDSIECYKIEQYLGYPGFVRLRGLGKINYNWKYKKYEFSRRIFPNRYHVSDMVAKVNSIHWEKGMENTVRGPAITIHLGPGSLFQMLDIVNSLWCPQWPKEAQGWTQRPRNYGWPTTDTISEVVQNGCHVVYIQHRSCRDDELQWRLSFSVAEVILLQSWTQSQQIVYHLLRFFAKKELIQADCPKEDEVLCTYHLKTLMLWTCEDMSPGWWNSSSVIVICCELLQKLSEWLKRRYCPNYFVPEANLFHVPSCSIILEKTGKKLNEFRDSKILCNWFLENYIQPFFEKLFIVVNAVKLLPDLLDYMADIVVYRKSMESQSLDDLFLRKFLDFNVMKFEVMGGRFIPCFLCLMRKFELLSHSQWSSLLISEKVWNVKYYVSTLYCVNIAHGVASGNISWESEAFVEFVKELCLKPNIARCQYPRYPEATTTGSQFQFLRAQNFLEYLGGKESRSEFQLLCIMSKAFLRKALECDDSQSDIFVPAALVYLAALHFAASQYQIAIDLCSSVLQGHQLFFQIETLNAGCLFFIDDVARIVGFCLLSKMFSENMHFSKRQIYLDLRLTPKVFAHYLVVISTERMSKQLELNRNIPTPSFPLDHFLTVSTKRKFCLSMRSSTCFKAVRQCVYRRTVSLTAYTTSSVNHSRIEEKITDALWECALENMTSFYSGIGIKCKLCNTAGCYRALYLYKCRQYDEVLHLCEEILHQPDLQNDIKQFIFASVLLLPPLDTFFDRDAQCLLGLHTLFYYLSPLNDYLRKFEFTRESTFAHIFSRVVYADKLPLSKSLLMPYPIRCHYSLGGHFLARYLKLRCLIDCEHPCTEALAELAAMKTYRPFEHIIRRFVLQKFPKSRRNPRFLSHQ